MRSEEAYKAEVFARRDAVLRVRRRRRRAMLSLLPILCVAGISAAFFLRLPQNAPTKESADGTQKTEATRFAGQSGDTNGSVDDDTADGIADGDTECYKMMLSATVLTVADVPFLPQTVYWADDEKTVKAFAEQTEDTGLQAQLASYDAAFFKTHRLFIYYLPDSTVTALFAHVDGTVLEILPQSLRDDAVGSRLFLLSVERWLTDGVETVRVADTTKVSAPFVAPNATDTK